MENELDLKNPFDGISNYESFKAKCRDIASKLFNNYGIKCNNKIFRLAEIEFYYYDSEQYLKDPVITNGKKSLILVMIIKEVSCSIILAE